jgi:hypothetical protein
MAPWAPWRPVWVKSAVPFDGSVRQEPANSQSDGERASRIDRISWLGDPPPDGWEEKLDQNELIEELKLQALYDAKGAIALGEWCELPTEAIDSIRAWANPPERSAVWDRRNPWCGRAWCTSLVWGDPDAGARYAKSAPNRRSAKIAPSQLNLADRNTVPARRRRAKQWTSKRRVKVSRANEADAIQAKVLTQDEARRIAANIAKLPALVKREDWRPVQPHSAGERQA